jgi:hypothetical protein
MHETKRSKGYLLRTPKHELVTTNKLMETSGNQRFLDLPTQTTQIRFIGMQGTMRFTNIPKQN